MSDQLAEHYLENSRQRFRAMQELAEGAVVQVTDEEFSRALDPESNSIAAIIKHLGGNMLSRWTDFLTADGEKPWRDREAEFAAETDRREAVMDGWAAGWACLFAALEGLSPEDLLRTVTIRRETHTVVEAINRQLTHYAYHVGQIVFLAKHFRSSDWRTLSIARGRSGAFNEEVWKRLETSPER